jgi:hypothetical protein
MLDMAVSQLPICVQWIQALGPTIVTIVVGAIAGSIAWRQWSTSHDRLRLDMYEKRFAVYSAARKLINTAEVHGQTTIDDLGDFYQGIRGAEFLFDGDTRTFVSKIGVMAFKARSARARLQRQPNHPKSDELNDEEDKMLDFLRREGDKLETVFNRYLDLSKVGLMK